MVQLRDVWSEEIEQALAGKKTAKQALDAAVERGNTMLRQFEKTAVQIRRRQPAGRTISGLPAPPPSCKSKPFSNQSCCPTRWLRRSSRSS